MWNDNRTIEEIKESLSKQLDEMEQQPVKPQIQVKKEVDQALTGKKNSGDWNTYREIKKIVGWNLDPNDYTKQMDYVLKYLNL
jgi:hypothetical protein